jgi:hypothetical protein
MRLIVLSPQELPHGLAALAAVMRAKGPLVPAERAFLAALCREHGADVDLDTLVEAELARAELAEPDLAELPLADLATRIVDPAKRRWLVQLAVVAALVTGQPARAHHAAVRALDRALGVGERGLAVLGHLVRGNLRGARLALLPRLYPRFFVSAYRHGGLPLLRKTFGGFTRGYRDPAVAWRFRQLGLLPEGTVGRAFWEHFTRNRFKFPGEPDGLMSERMIFHDFGHILSGYGTDAAGEIRQGAFQAGYARDDGFVFLMFILMQFHLGIRLTPVTSAQRGHFDPAAVLHALGRGAASRVDLSDCWDHWEAVELDIAAWRERCGVPPVSPAADPHTVRA